MRISPSEDFTSKESAGPGIYPEIAANVFWDREIAQAAVPRLIT
jgi:hypothetical protein